MSISDELAKLIPIGEENAVSGLLLWKQLKMWSPASIKHTLRLMARDGLIEREQPTDARRSYLSGRAVGSGQAPEADRQRKFEDPIPLPKGRQLVTLKDAAYITKLPKKESDLPEWQTAIEVLLLCSRGGPTMMARIGVMKALNRHVERVFNPAQRYPLGQTEAQERPMTVLIYVDTSKQIGDPDHLTVFANADAAETWFEENDPEGVAFEYEVLE